MAYVTSSRNQALHHLPLVARLGEIFGQFADAMALHREFRRTRRELAALTDGELRDLGLNRSMLSSMAWEAAAQSVEGQRSR